LDFGAETVLVSLFPSNLLVSSIISLIASAILALKSCLLYNFDCENSLYSRSEQLVQEEKDQDIKQNLIKRF
jgi:hypothetical protein